MVIDNDKIDSLLSIIRNLNANSRDAVKDIKEFNNSGYADAHIKCGINGNRLLEGLESRSREIDGKLNKAMFYLARDAGVYYIDICDEDEVYDEG